MSARETNRTRVLVQLSEPVPVEAVGATEASELVRSGKAFLKVSAYPWGVEFDIVRSA